MTTTPQHAARTGMGAFGVRMAIAALLALGLGACNTGDILHVNDPDVPGPGALNTVSSLPVLYAGAIGDFETGYQGEAYGSSEVGQIEASGLLTDELTTADVFIDREKIDQRAVTTVNGANGPAFRQIETARASADRVASAYAQLAPDSSERAVMLALSGFATVILGENYCSGVSLSTFDVNTNAITYGDPLTTSQMWATALAKFDSAAAVPGISDTIQNLIAVGRGRALVDSGNYAAAAAAVANVPAGFVFNIASSSTTLSEYNGVWSDIDYTKIMSVSDREGGNGLNFVSANDPRVPTDTLGVGLDGSTQVTGQLKYPTAASPAPLATAIEARLIEAEAALQSGDPGTFLAKLNAARAEFPGMPPLSVDSVPATDSGKVTLLFRERAFDLFLTSHRLGDLRRLIRQYGRSAETVFPTGAWVRGGQYGTDVNLPIPQEEQNNPKSKGCLDRNP